MVGPSGETLQPIEAGPQTAASTTSRDPASDLVSARPPAGWHVCGAVNCDGYGPYHGWQVVRGKIFAPRGSAFYYMVYLRSNWWLSWGGSFSLNHGPKIFRWASFKTGTWLNSPAIILAGAGPVGYDIKVASRSPQGQTYTVYVRVVSPYRCTKPILEG